MVDYLRKTLQHREVKLANDVPDFPLQEGGEKISVGDWVLVKVIQRKQWFNPRWEGPFWAVHEQLAATSLMAFQNRIALDMLLAEKGGVCGMFGEQCCTFIPNNTAPDGRLTRATEGLKTLNKKMKEHSGVDTSVWDGWLDQFGRFKGLIASALMSVAVFAALSTLCGCCCVPCIRALIIILSMLTANRMDCLIFFPKTTGRRHFRAGWTESDWSCLLSSRERHARLLCVSLLLYW